MNEKLKAGMRVRMTEDLKKRLRGQCGEAGKHLGPFDPEAKDQSAQNCWGCSSAHVEEFGDCEGKVEGPMFPDSEAPEVDVRWHSSNLRYGYHPDELEPLRVVVESEEHLDPG